MKLNKGDFIEIKFTGKIKDTDEIFDSNVEEDIKKSGLNLKSEPFIFALGEDMFLKGVDEFLIDKDLGEYSVELSPEKAFGKRDSKLINMVPSKVFKEQKLNPFPGAVFNFDGRMAKVLSVSGGRVMVDFNNPIAGKVVKYNLKVLRKIEDINEKIKSLNNFFFRKDFKFETKDKKLIINADKPYIKFIEMFKDKYKEILNLDLEVREVEIKQETKSETQSQ
ncbi:MAG: FKBP-type peptidyl-prolyl cis-trans isomerase [Candidatus Pacearchaeota archaeon]|jgi:FKBP-type peptidyl-prolyl cis-trans isomerase SlyD